AAFAAAVALLVVFAKPLLENVAPRLRADSQTGQGSKSAERVAVNDISANGALNPTTAMAAVPSGAPVQQAPLTQQASLSPISNQSGPVRNDSVRGVNNSEIRFGISAPFSGSAKELGQRMKLGIEAAFNAANANANGGLYGRQLRLVAADDGY